MGPVITTQNKKLFYNQFKLDYLRKVADAGNPKGMNDQEIRILAEVYAQTEVKKQIKHLDAYIKGKDFYYLFGRRYDVITPEFLLKQKEKEEYLNQLSQQEEE